MRRSIWSIITICHRMSPSFTECRPADIPTKCDAVDRRCARDTSGLQAGTEQHCFDQRAASVEGCRVLRPASSVMIVFDARSISLPRMFGPGRIPGLRLRC